MDQLIVMWEEVLPGKGIKMLREVELVGMLPQIHLVERPLRRNCPAVTLGLVFQGRRRDIHKVLYQKNSRRLSHLPLMEKSRKEKKPRLVYWG
jgi:hypothetical protein